MHEEEKFTILGAGTDFRGKMQFRTALIIQGRYEGRILAEGNLAIEDHAVVRADVVAKSLLVTGSLTGNAKIMQQVEVLGTGSLIGDVSASDIHIEKGSTFRGRLSMLKDPDSIDICLLYTSDAADEQYIV